MSSKKTDIWMPLYIAQYLGDTMHLTTRQHGAYLLLIMAYWRNRGPLPADDRRLAAICRLSLPEWREDRETIAEFFEECGGVWRQKRIDLELHEALKNVQQASEKGKAGAAARWQKDATGNAPAIPQAQSEQCSGNASSPTPTPIPKTTPEPAPKTHTPAGADVLQVFDHWRLRMGHQKAKLDAKRKKIIAKAFDLGYSLTDLIAAVDGCAKSAWHMGQNDRGIVYDDIGLILRDAEKIDRFIKLNLQLVQREDGTYESEQQRIARLSKSAAGRVQLNAEREAAATRSIDQAPLGHDDQNLRPPLDVSIQ